MSVRRSLKLASLMFLALLLGNAVIFTLSPSVEAAGPVYFKWKAYLGPKAGTFIAPLAADLTGDGKWKSSSQEARKTMALMAP